MLNNTWMPSGIPSSSLSILFVYRGQWGIFSLVFAENTSNKDTDSRKTISSNKVVPTSTLAFHELFLYTAIITYCLCFFRIR